MGAVQDRIFRPAPSDPHNRGVAGGNLTSYTDGSYRLPETKPRSTHYFAEYRPASDPPLGFVKSFMIPIYRELSETGKQMIRKQGGVGDGRFWNSLAEKSLAGELLSAEEGRAILTSDDLELPSLLAAAFRVREKYFGKAVQLYYLRNAKSGLCPEDCGYCSQSKLSKAPIDKYVFQDEKTLLEGARQAKESQARTFCIVASGRGPNERELNHVASVVRKIKETYGLHICVCLGLLTSDQAQVLKDAGVDRVNHNLNTSQRLYDEICSTHSYQDRVETLKAVRGAGMELCSGCIIGMGESPDDLIELAMTLREMQVESIPVNFLHPIDGTPLENIHNLTPRDCLRALCLFRLMNPNRELRIAGGREIHLRSLQPLGLYAANSLFVSDYLTTKGQSAEDDYRMIEDLGFEIVKMGCEFEAGSTEARDVPATASAH